VRKGLVGFANHGGYEEEMEKRYQQW